ncbi:porin family protein [Ulvibacterium marinum]|uniref:porin family protein n=1 Tax=Ulvibacterium marinum TaxID=2419782 RepID=UPI0024945ACC|nr:porin family protein [Ulvibacterium marinum]
MNKVFFGLLLFLFSGMTYAQTNIRPGIRLGFNSANISNTNLDNKIGPNAAVFVDFRFSRHYSLQPEIMYSRQGGKSNIRTNEDLDIDYLSFGVVNKFFVAPNQGLHLILGPSLDFDFENNLINVINETNDSDVTPLDLSFFFGIGYEFDFGLILEARYKQGLLDIDLFDEDFESDFYRGEGNTLNNVFQFGVAYKFDLR